jgi:hypothetical protein
MILLLLGFDLSLQINKIKLEERNNYLLQKKITKLYKDEKNTYLS